MSTTLASMRAITPEAGSAWLVVGDLMTNKLAGSDTGGTFTLYETVVQPGGGPPFHTHPVQEVFYVLEGDLAFTEVRDGATHTESGTPGTTIHLPANVPHAYRNVGHGVARMLTLFVTAGKMDAFFADLGLPVADKAHLPQPDGPPDLAAVAAICTRHDVGLIPPPGAH